MEFQGKSAVAIVGAGEDAPAVVAQEGRLSLMWTINGELHEPIDLRISPENE